MKFSIITPSYNQVEWLDLCIKSIANQEGVEIEHIIQDAGSNDGTVEYLKTLTNGGKRRIYPKTYQFSWTSEPDDGMYDAINKGWGKASGDIIAYLNCDEQYLPGTLKNIAEYFKEHPDVDVVFADVVVIKPDGEYICHRSPIIPRKYLSTVYCPAFTCATFLRRHVFKDLGVKFDISWKTQGDMDWYNRLAEEQIKMKAIRNFSTAFVDTGENLDLREEAYNEKQRYYNSLPVWLRRTKPLLIQYNRIRRLIRELPRIKMFDYEIYTLRNPNQRQLFNCSKPRFLWRRRTHVRQL